MMNGRGKNFNREDTTLDSVSKRKEREGRKKRRREEGRKGGREERKKGRLVSKCTHLLFSCVGVGLAERNPPPLMQEGSS